MIVEQAIILTADEGVVSKADRENAIDSLLIFLRDVFRQISIEKAHEIAQKTQVKFIWNQLLDRGNEIIFLFLHQLFAQLAIDHSSFKWFAFYIHFIQAETIFSKPIGSNLVKAWAKLLSLQLQRRGVGNLWRAILMIWRKIIRPNSIIRLNSPKAIANRLIHFFHFGIIAVLSFQLKNTLLIGKGGEYD
jgi:hypothetical protein